MGTDAEDTPEALRAKHLRELVSSPGWTLFLQYVEQSWGPAAQLDMMDKAYEQITAGDEDAERMTGLQIRASARSIQRLVNWPAQQIGVLQTQQRAPTRIFDGFRRAR